MSPNTSELSFRKWRIRLFFFFPPNFFSTFRATLKRNFNPSFGNFKKYEFLKKLSKSPLCFFRSFLALFFSLKSNLASEMRFFCSNFWKTGARHSLSRHQKTFNFFFARRRQISRNASRGFFHLSWETVKLFLDELKIFESPEATEARLIELAWVKLILRGPDDSLECFPKEKYFRWSN